MKKKTVAFVLLACLFFTAAFAEDGYRLWLRYDRIPNGQMLAAYRSRIGSVAVLGQSPTLSVAGDELVKGLSGLLGIRQTTGATIGEHSIVIGTIAAPAIGGTGIETRGLGEEGFLIAFRKIAGKQCLIITGNTDKGVLYGSFYFLQQLQQQKNFASIPVASSPKLQLRVLNHWDNMNRSVERGYAGFSLWKWHLLPGYIDQRYIDYARANASIGINGTVVNNVNANALMLTKEYLVKVKALADVFRPYGIRLYLSAKFSAPIEIGRLKTADPLDPEVRDWWKKKIDEIYSYVPDFGGLLVKANSEGQPGPQNYRRTHADGANMLAEALAPHNGIVMWRAFVYSNEVPVDRTKQSYNEFKPFDGQFRNNVLVQVKNGPLDFQPREPFHPLFGAMPKTPLMMEFQLTQEYLGQGTQLVYEAPLMKEVLDADTYAYGKGSTVARVIDGSADRHTLTGIAGVSNIGDDRNWCGHPFAQANWYAYGKLAWDHNRSSEQIADEWIRMTFSNDPSFVGPVKQMMLSSRETMVHYMTPVGLHHIMGDGHHYGPSPWSDKLGRADWNPVYYHKADSLGLGFARNSKGTNALEQYAPEVRKIYEDLSDCPEEYLLWFHHVGWNYRMRSGRTLWNELCFRYYQGVEEVRAMQQLWNQTKSQVDEERFNHVRMLLSVQEKEAVWWRNACLLYFATFSKKPIPTDYAQPEHTLDYYKSLRFQFVPGNGNNGN
ncbi:alpha-glucuronidase family glycosyl hydrolase [Sediminibacterium soli]|uniref:alpha-glucuronidase family glycosyl hydrolase n=1 Tax=Sediminibacterium soli TaxID=2698829 RepID=UPI00137978E7|nr:alpha-glucuronidase family glycosyl hydrolase [Sediminibacterium soli]NCI45739.1 alpha-glucuronidase [Sediminibacterium soli]